MLPLHTLKAGKANLKLLCMGAHSDDIEIGCGGTLLELLRLRKDIEVHWVVFSSGAPREREARRSADLFLKGAAKKEVIVQDFRNGYFPFVLSDIKDYFEELKRQINPDIIFTHTRDDRHQDHRSLNQLTWNTWRDHLILEYEVPKYDGDLGTPNCYFPFDNKIAQRKIKFLMDCFGTQRDKHWFTPDTFQGLMRIRGLESNSPGKFAEGFYARKLVWHE
jgi:LmbE family N-acetylglucosaminyl deacetylase